MRSHIIWAALAFTVIVFVFFPEIASAQSINIPGLGGGGAFQSKMESIQQRLINVILPIASTFGLIWGSLLMARGDEGAKTKIVLVIVGSILGFTAPLLIAWLKGIAN